MTKEKARREGGFRGLSRLWGRKSLAAIFLVMFLLGYNMTTSQVQQCNAQCAMVNGAPSCGAVAGGVFTTPGGSTCPVVAGCNASCEPTNTAVDLAFFMAIDFHSQIVAAAGAMETWLFNYVDQIMQSEYDQVVWMEDSMIDFWNTMWSYNLLPGLQGMTRQLNIDLSQQAFLMQSNADATTMMEIDRALNKHEITDNGISPGEQICVAATSAGGFTRVDGLARLMRQAWENESMAGGLNTKVIGVAQTPNPTSSSSVSGRAQLYKDYYNIFCDPNANGGYNKCGASAGINPPLYNADVEPIKYIFNNLTIPVDTLDNPAEGQDVSIAVRDIINNMVGTPSADPILPKALSGPEGEEVFLQRRSYLARYAAIRSVPDMIAGWRMPGSTSPSTGSTLGQFVSDLRSSSGVTINNISKNPSYREIMHALSVERFNSGNYAAEMMTDPNKVQMEKLNLSVFYLMQLRDYYELLERTALTLSVQVSLLSGEQLQALPEIRKSMKLQ